MWELPDYPVEYLVFGLLITLENKINKKGTNFYEEITLKQWGVLTLLETFQQPPTLKQLAKVGDTSHQNMKQLVVKLQEKGYLDIVSDTKDLRSLRIIRTQKTEDFRKKYEAKQHQFIQQIFKYIDSNDLELIKKVLLQIIKNTEDIQ